MSGAGSSQVPSSHRVRPGSLRRQFAAPSPSPKTAVARIIVVERQQAPAAGMAFHPRQCLDDGSVFQPLASSTSPAPAHGRHHGCEPLAKGVDRIEACFRYGRPDARFKAAKRFAKLPASHVQNAHHSLPCWRLARPSCSGKFSEQSVCGKPLDGCQERLDGCQERSRSLPPRNGYLLPKSDQTKNIEFCLHRWSAL